MALDAQVKVETKAYRAPSLTVFGGMSALTATGTGNMKETQNMTTMVCESNMNRAMC